MQMRANDHRHAVPGKGQGAAPGLFPLGLLSLGGNGAWTVAACIDWFLPTFCKKFLFCYFQFSYQDVHRQEEWTGKLYECRKPTSIASSLSKAANPCPAPETQASLGLGGGAVRSFLPGSDTSEVMGKPTARASLKTAYSGCGGVVGG